mgnify:CR=1 FL=1
MQQETIESLREAHLVLARNPFWSPKQKLWTLRLLAKATYVFFWGGFMMILR